MATLPERRALGRGLSALMAEIGADEAADAPSADLRRVPIESVVPNPDQPRRHFAADELAELAASIASRGVLQPLIVRYQGDSGLYQIVAGERRWRAAQQARLHELPVIVRAFSDTEVLEVALIENIQRSNLNPIEEASAYRHLMERFEHTQEQLAEALHKSRSHVANHLRLLTLPEPVIGWVQDGSLSAGHARALITASDPTALARRVIDRGLSVRETETLARNAAEPPRPRLPRKPSGKDADTLTLEGDLSAQLKMGVRIDHVGTEGGRMTITYRSLEQLDLLCQLLARD